MDRAVTNRRKIAEVKSVCCYCGTGCGVAIETDGVNLLNVRGDPDHPVNRGQLCIKGQTLAAAHVRTGRATRPLIRPKRGAAFQPTDWDTALRLNAERFAQIIATHGPDAVAFYVSGQLLTEDYYLFNKLARGLVGTNNIDSNSRLCMSSAVTAYKSTLGSDTVPCCYEDIDLADLYLLAGSNAAITHPILFRRIEAAKNRHPERQILVIDPRRSETAAYADLHLAIQPGTDTFLFAAMLHVLVWERMIDEAFIATHTEGFEALRRELAELTPGAVSPICGLSPETIVDAARRFGSAQSPLSLWCQGLNQSIHGTSDGVALIHLHLATGKIGRPGMGPFSLTGQPNAMGGRETGTMATLLPGHRDPNSEKDRSELAHLWGIPSLPERPGKTAVEIFDALAEGTIKAIWIACTNPAHSLPHLEHAVEALRRAEWVVLQDAWQDTETAPFADLLLPAATWGEKEGTMTNSERRISRVRAAVPPPGEAKPDWWIVQAFARHLGKALGIPERAERLFSFPTEEAIFLDYARTTAGTEIAIETLTYATLDQLGPQQWPFTSGQSQARPFSDHRFSYPDGKARFQTLDRSRLPEQIDARHPFLLITGRLRDQWHGMSRTGRIPQLFRHDPEPVVCMNRTDLERRGWHEGDLLRLRSRRGELILPVAAADEVRSGHLFLAMHWGRRSLSGEGSNALTLAATDPLSKQPHLKHAAVRVEKCNLPWRTVILRRSDHPDNPIEPLLQWQAALRPLVANFPYAALTLDEGRWPILRVTLAHSTPPEDELLERLASLLALSGPELLQYEDRSNHILKRARIAERQLTGILLSGETAAAHWLCEAIKNGTQTDTFHRWLFAPLAEPPLADLTSSRIVCNCRMVSETAIRSAVAAGADLERLQAELGCGTVCGSCLPEIRKITLEARAVQ
jgi:assimilatory nitrate reductase catalytic subunit